MTLLFFFVFFLFFFWFSKQAWGVQLYFPASTIELGSNGVCL